MSCDFSGHKNELTREDQKITRILSLRTGLFGTLPRDVNLSEDSSADIEYISQASLIGIARLLKRILEILFIQEIKVLLFDKETHHLTSFEVVKVDVALLWLRVRVSAA